MGDVDHPPVLLIMGLGAQLLLWRTGFCEKLVAEGLRVIRYDNRDVGLSDKTERPRAGQPLVPRLLRFWLGLPGRASTASRTWPTTPPRCWTTWASSAPTSSGRRWGA